MPTLALSKKQSEEKPEPITPPVIADLKSLANKLIQQGRQLPPFDASPDDAEEDEVLLDMEMEGVRCLLLRTHSKMASSTVTLSPREHEIARMIAKGYPNKAIAAVLDISAWTVCTHIRRVFAKLGVGSRAEMVAKLLEHGSFNGSGALPYQPFKSKN